MAKPVKIAYLNEGIFIPGIGDLKKTLPPQDKTLRNFKMVLQDNGFLFLSFDIQGGMVQEFTVGASNIKGLMHPPVKKEIAPVVGPKDTENTAQAS